MDRRHETIDALLDGERVDPTELKEALARAEGRDYLVDALALRELVAETSPAARVAIPAVPSWQRRIQWPAAAAILVASLVAGFAAGYRSAGSGAPPPPAAREATAGVGAPKSSPPLLAPAPTRVIRLESGVDWTEGVGGD
jgi:hypothetical protein